MSSYILSADAEQDLREIARYTLDNWGQQQLNRYRRQLKTQFEAIGSGDIIQRQVSENLSNVHVAKAGAHFIFYLTPAHHKPIIIAIFHEARDYVRLLSSRLDDKI